MHAPYVLLVLSKRKVTRARARGGALGRPSEPGKPVGEQRQRPGGPQGRVGGTSWRHPSTPVADSGFVLVLLFAVAAVAADPTAALRAYLVEDVGAVAAVDEDDCKRDIAVVVDKDNGKRDLAVGW